MDAAYPLSIRLEERINRDICKIAPVIKCDRITSPECWSAKRNGCGKDGVAAGKSSGNRFRAELWINVLATGTNLLVLAIRIEAEGHSDVSLDGFKIKGHE